MVRNKNNKIFNIFISMRPRQWTKNAFVFAGLIFSRSFFNIGFILKSIGSFIAFCMVSGSVYIINDIIDREKDALHPYKSKRPIASGALRPLDAAVSAIIIFGISLYLSLILSESLFYIILVYFTLICVYSITLKKVVIVDIILIAMGFVLRTVGGAAAINVKISPWLIVCTTLLALFLALNKRKNEILVLAENAAGHRKILGEYTPELIDQMISVITSSTVMSYMLYTFNAGKSSYMMLTIPYVLYGIFRYQYLVSTRAAGGSPEMVLLKDRPFLVNIILWIVSSIIIVAIFY